MTHDQKIFENKLENEIVYYPGKDYNGVLIILREPGGGVNGNSEQTDFEGNRKWFRKVAGVDHVDKLTRQESRYRKRFCEMLRYIGIEEDGLKNIAYTNIKLKAGGSEASPEYWRLEKLSILNNKLEIVNNAGTATHTVFLCREVFNAVVGQYKTEFALCYKGKQSERAAYIDGVWYFEIRHPSRSPRIMIKQSTLSSEYKLMAERKG